MKLFVLPRFKRKRANDQHKKIGYVYCINIYYTPKQETTHHAFRLCVWRLKTECSRLIRVLCWAKTQVVFFFNLLLSLYSFLSICKMIKLNYRVLHIVHLHIFLRQKNNNQSKNARNRDGEREREWKRRGKKITRETFIVYSRFILTKSLCKQRSCPLLVCMRTIIFSFLLLHHTCT